MIIVCLIQQNRSTASIRTLDQRLEKKSMAREKTKAGKHPMGSLSTGETSLTRAWWRKKERKFGKGQPNHAALILAKKCQSSLHQSGSIIRLITLIPLSMHLTPSRCTSFNLVRIFLVCRDDHLSRTGLGFGMVLRKCLAMSTGDLGHRILIARLSI